jgi:hypothetical protein
MAQFSGIAGPHVYNSRFGPTYRTSYIICLSFLVVAICGVISSWVLVWRGDRGRAREEEERGEVGEGQGERVITSGKGDGEKV